jgi:hypothetical protein
MGIIFRYTNQILKENISLYRLINQKIKPPEDFKGTKLEYIYGELQLSNEYATELERITGKRKAKVRNKPIKNNENTEEFLKQRLIEYYNQGFVFTNLLQIKKIANDKYLYYKFRSYARSSKKKSIKLLEEMYEKLGILEGYKNKDLSVNTSSSKEERIIKSLNQHFSAGTIFTTSISMRKKDPLHWGRVYNKYKLPKEYPGNRWEYFYEKAGLLEEYKKVLNERTN